MYIQMINGVDGQHNMIDDSNFFHEKYIVEFIDKKEEKKYKTNFYTEIEMRRFVNEALKYKNLIIFKIYFMADYRYE